MLPKYAMCAVVQYVSYVCIILFSIADSWKHQQSSNSRGMGNLYAHHMSQSEYEFSFKFRNMVSQVRFCCESVRPQRATDGLLILMTSNTIQQFGSPVLRRVAQMTFAFLFPVPLFIFSFGSRRFKVLSTKSALVSFLANMSLQRPRKLSVLRKCFLAHSALDISTAVMISKKVP